jgi:hypothetical protein
MLRITWKKNYQLIYKLTLEQLPIIYFINLKREMIKKKVRIISSYMVQHLDKYLWQDRLQNVKVKIKKKKLKRKQKIVFKSKT